MQTAILSCGAVRSDAADEERAVPFRGVSSSHDAEAETPLTIFLERDGELRRTVEEERERERVGGREERRRGWMKGGTEGRERREFMSRTSDSI